MFQELINGLTQEQKQELITRGIPQPRLSDWKRGKRLPTRTQVLILADVTKHDPLEIEAEIMLMETPPEQRDLFKRLMGVAASVFLVLGMFGAPSNANADQGSRPLTRGGHVLHIVESI